MTASDCGAVTTASSPCSTAAISPVSSGIGPEIAASSPVRADADGTASSPAPGATGSGLAADALATAETGAAAGGSVGGPCSSPVSSASPDRAAGATSWLEAGAAGALSPLTAVVSSGEEVAGAIDKGLLAVRSVSWVTPVPGAGVAGIAAIALAGLMSSGSVLSKVSEPGGGSSLSGICTLCSGT